jgi:DNA modification methylase
MTKLPNSTRYEHLPTGALKPRERQARKHSKKQIKQIARSFEQFGFLNPIIVDEDHAILAGRARWEAAKELGLATVPTIQVSCLSGDEKRAYALADNRLSELSEWNFEILQEEVQLLLDAELDFDIDIIGFDAADIDGWGNHSEAREQEAVELPSANVSVSQLGDLWLIGKHRLLCGDSLKPSSYEVLMAGEKAQMVFADPPYNVAICGNVSGMGTVKHREFAMGSGEMSKPGFTMFLRTACARMAEVSAPEAIHFICMDWRHLREMQDAGDAVYHELKNVCVWAKTNAGMGTFYRSQTEFVFAYKVGPGKHINNFGLGEKGRHRSNLWTYAGANTFRAGRMDDLAQHPTVKPVQMVYDAILDCSKPKGIVLDSFAGVGTTLVAAARAGRRGYGIELDPIYVDCALARLEKELGISATLEDGQTFAEVREQRLKQEAA